jgi:anti-anti-sigma factor
MASTPGLSLSIMDSEEGVCVRAHGELDRSTAEVFTTRLAEVIAMRRSPIVVDLSQICFADVVGYLATTRLGQRCADNGLAIIWVHPSPPVKLLWRILGEPGGTSQGTDRAAESVRAIVRQHPPRTHSADARPVA